MWPPVSSVTHIWTMPSAQTDSPSNLWNVTVISRPAICMRVVCSSCTICTTTADLDLFYKASSSTDGMAAVWEEVGTAKPDVSICSLTRWPRSSKTPVTLLPHCKYLLIRFEPRRLIIWILQPHNDWPTEIIWKIYDEPTQICFQHAGREREPTLVLINQKISPASAAAQTQVVF